MATSLPNGIYTGGAVKFDSSPYANFYLQSLAKQQARRDAIDNYYNELGKNLTPAGMASNDVDDFVSKVNDWRNYVSSNRGILDNPRDKNYSSAVNQANYLYNDALAHAAKSKQKVASITQTRQLIKPDHPLTDESLLTIHNGTLPLSDKNYKDIDLSTIQYEDALTPAKIDSVINNSIKGIHLGSEIKDVAIDPITHTKKYTTTFKYDQPNLDALRSNAAFALRNPQIKKYVHDIMQPDGMTMKDGVPVPSSALYDQLNKNFKDAYGRDIDDETDAWTAVLLTRAKQAYQTQKAVNDQESLHQSNRNYDIAHPLPHYGSGGVNPNTGSNWGEDAADALKNNDTDTFNNLINYTKQGNGKIQIIDAFVRNIDGNDFVFVQTAPKYSNGKLGNTNTQKIALKDSALPNILFGIYQSAMGADAKQERSNYPTPTPPKTTPKPTPPKTTPKPTPPKTTPKPNPLPHYGSGGVNPNTGSNWGEDAADALKNNDTDTFNNLINYTKQGNGKIQIIDAFVRNIDGNDFVFVQTAPKYSNGKLGNTNTQKIALKDSALPNILFGIYQSAMGKKGILD